MVLLISSYGVKIRKRDGCIVVERKEGGTQQFSPQDVDSIVLSNPCTLTSEVISLCQENNINITMTNRQGLPLWHVEAFQGGSVPLLRRKQLLLCDHAEGVQLVKTLLSMKLNARIRLLQKLANNRRNEQGDTLRIQSERISVLSNKIQAVSGGNIAECRHTLQGYEGSAGRIYFSSLSKILPPETNFTGRETGMEAGPFNQMLNYGYGVLYREILAQCGKARLDPYIGVMHTDGYNRPALVFDLVEPFRAEIEQAVFFLFSRKKAHLDVHFEKCEQGLLLSQTGKQLLMEAIYRVRQEKHAVKMEQLVSSLAKGLDNWSVEGGAYDLVADL